MNKKPLGCAVLGLLLWWPAAVRGDPNSDVERAREIVPQLLLEDMR